MRLINYLKVKEQRKFPRIKMNVPCVIFVLEQQFIGYILDLSQGGLKLEVSDSLLESDNFIVHFYFDIYLFKYKCSIISIDGKIITAVFIGREDDSSDKLGFMLNIIDMGEGLV